ncbi:hypothetical protein JOC77_003245 [Peribacillus deserti]|uniref:Uncharacterized protein n=1 Tax=Peribacillus deserti TaxID=673318 RepID=A0ABS2QKW8_9BACI|nr:hypothetical protein [Peribacillus deserti]
MKIYRLIKNYKDLYKKGTVFFLISESEFIGVKEFTLQCADLKGKLYLSKQELNSYFVLNKYRGVNND